MRLGVKDGAECDSVLCTVVVGTAFTLSVEIIEPPAEGYVGAQSFIDFGTDLAYHATKTTVGELVWPDCESVVANRSKLSAETVSHGCLTGIPPMQHNSTYIGNFVDMAFTCSKGPSSTLVRLLPFGDPFAGTSGTKFVLDTGSPVAAKVSDLTVECGDVPTPTPTPSSQPTFPPPPVPTLSSLVGDASCDGTVNALDAALLLQLDAGLVAALPCPEAGDVNGDGESNALDAALVLQFSAGLLADLPP